MAEHNLEWDSLLMPCSIKGDSAQAILLDEMVFDDAQCDDELAYHPFGELWTGGGGITEQLQEGQGASSPHACSSAALGHPTLAAGLAGSSPCSPNHKPAAKLVEVPPPVAEVSRACSLVRPYNEAVRCAPSSNTTCPTAAPVPDSHTPRQYVHPPVASPRTYWGPVTTGGQSVQLGNGLAATAAAPGLSGQEPLLLPSMPSGPYLSKVPDSTDRQLQSIMRQLEMSSPSTPADPEMFTLSRHGSMLTTPATSEHSSTDTHFLSGMFLVCAAPKPSPCPVLNSPSAAAAATPSSFNRAASVSGPMAALAQQHSLEHQLSLPVPQQLQSPVPAAPAAGTALRRGAVTLPVPPAATVPAAGAMAVRAVMVDVPPQPTDIKKRAAGNEGLDMAAAKRKPGRQPAGAPPSLAAPQAPGSTATPRLRKTPKRHSCHNCGVHSTPQWRCGPDGPRTLCNACGVRYKKGLPLRSYPYKDAQGLAARAPAVASQLEPAPSAAQPASPGMAQAGAPLVPCAAAQARPAHAAPELQQLAVPSQQLQRMLPPQQPQLALRGQSGVACPTIFAVGSSLPATGYCF